MKKIFQTELTVSASSAEGSRDLSSAYEMHRTLSRVFCGKKFLWSLQSTPYAANVSAESGEQPAPFLSDRTLRVRSAYRGDWAVLSDLKGYVQHPTPNHTQAGITQEVLDPWPLLQEGKSLHMSVQANPATITQGTPSVSKKKRQGIYGRAEQKAWMESELARSGFAASLIDASSTKTVRALKPQSGDWIQFVSVFFELQCTVVNQEAALKAFIQGVGPQKAMGQGMLILRK